jgi:integrase
MDLPHDADGYAFDLPKRNPNMIAHAWALVKKGAGVTDGRFHDCRHSAATLMSATGADVRTVQEILGHSSTSMTELYTHVTSDAAAPAVHEPPAQRAHPCPSWKLNRTIRDSN